MAKSPKAKLELRFYVAGQPSKSWLAFANLEVVDLLENPQQAAGDRILALLALVRKIMCWPRSTSGRGQQRRAHTIRKITGDLSDRERVLVGLDTIPREDHGA
jgi:circadian clock protein KaiB